MKKLDLERNTINQIDKEMADLFLKRMETSKRIALIKELNNLPVYDKTREDELIKKNLENIPPHIKKYYEEYLNDFLLISKRYQSNLLNHLTIYTNNTSYEVELEDNILDKVDSFIDKSKKNLIITDDGVPKVYIDKVKQALNTNYIYTIKMGEENKNIANYINILTYLSNNEFSRCDNVISLGGGVVGDLGGFVASSYMRGINFYNIPTTLLAQIDASIGGKTAIDFNGFKNNIGAFYLPKRVIIDPTTLLTLGSRELYSGIVEALKMALIGDENLFNLIEQENDIKSSLNFIIKSSLLLKKQIVEDDYKEEGIRKVLNLGHTIGHAVEAKMNGKLLHGECVGIGLLYVIKDEKLKLRVKHILEKFNLPTKTNILKEELYDLILHDKKRNSEYLDLVTISEIGKPKIERIKIEEIKNYL